MLHTFITELVIASMGILCVCVCVCVWASEFAHKFSLLTMGVSHVYLTCTECKGLCTHAVSCTEEHMQKISIGKRRGNSGTLSFYLQ